MTDGALDLMEWLRFLRKAKMEKYTVAETFFDFMTEAQCISVTTHSPYVRKFEL